VSSLSPIWMTARGAGLSAVVLLTTSTVLGTLASRHGAGSPHPNATRRYLMQYLHRTFAGLALAAVALHIVTILADSYAHVGWVGALVPLTSSYRPMTVALGTLAAYLLIGVAVLGLARGRMAASPRGARVWRRLHALAFVAWGAAMLHGFLSGTDSSVGWVRNLYIGCLLAVLAAVAVRLFTLRPARQGDRFAERRPRPVTRTQGVLR
jgi:predicted ferric reductase